MTEQKQEPKFWAVGESERLSFTDPDEAIEHCLDDWDYAQIADPPDEIKVTGYAPRKLHAAAFQDNPLEELLERIDEDYGDPEAYEGTQITNSMHAAEQVFIKAVLAEYNVWACDEVTVMTVKVMPWIEKNRPDYLYDHCIRCGAPYVKDDICEGLCSGTRSENPHQHLRSEEVK